MIEVTPKSASTPPMKPDNPCGARCPDLGSGMSALGHKQTCAAHKPMSAKCRSRTFATNASPALFDHHVGEREQCLRKFDP